MLVRWVVWNFWLLSMENMDGSWWANGLVSSERPGGFLGDFFRHFYRLFLQMFPHDLQNIHIFCMKMTSDWQSRITTGMQGELCHLQRKKNLWGCPKIADLHAPIVLDPERRAGHVSHMLNKGNPFRSEKIYMRLCVWLALLKSTCPVKVSEATWRWDVKWNQCRIFHAVEAIMSYKCHPYISCKSMHRAVEVAFCLAPGEEEKEKGKEGEKWEGREAQRRSCLHFNCVFELWGVRTRISSRCWTQASNVCWVR